MFWSIQNIILEKLNDAKMSSLKLKVPKIVRIKNEDIGMMSLFKWV